MEGENFNIEDVSEVSYQTPESKEETKEAIEDVFGKEMFSGLESLPDTYSQLKNKDKDKEIDANSELQKIFNDDHAKEEKQKAPSWKEKVMDVVGIREKDLDRRTAELIKREQSKTLKREDSVSKTVVGDTVVERREGSTEYSGGVITSTKEEGVKIVGEKNLDTESSRKHSDEEETRALAQEKFNARMAGTGTPGDVVDAMLRKEGIEPGTPEAEVRMRRFDWEEAEKELNAKKREENLGKETNKFSAVSGGEAKKEPAITESIKTPETISLKEARIKYAEMKLNLAGKEMSDEEVAKIEADYKEARRNERAELLDNAEKEFTGPELEKRKREIIIETVAGEATRLYDLKTELKLGAKRDSLPEKEKNIFYEKAKWVMNKIGSLYEKVPPKYKIALSIALISATIGVGGLAFGGTVFVEGIGTAGVGSTIMTAAVGGKFVQRVLGSMGATVVSEKLIKKSQEKQEREISAKGFEKIEEKFSDFLNSQNEELDKRFFEIEAGKKGKEIRRMALSGTMGFLVGSGATAQAMRNIMGADFVKSALGWVGEKLSATKEFFFGSTSSKVAGGVSSAWTDNIPKTNAGLKTSTGSEILGMEGKGMRLEDVQSGKLITGIEQDILEVKGGPSVAPGVIGHQAYAVPKSGDILSMDKVSSSAVVGKGEGITDVFKRQLMEQNPKMGDVEAGRKAFNIARESGYVSEAQEIRVQRPGIAYILNKDGSVSEAMPTKSGFVIQETHGGDGMKVPFEGVNKDSYEYTTKLGAVETKSGSGLIPKEGSVGLTDEKFLELDEKRSFAKNIKDVNNLEGPSIKGPYEDIGKMHDSNYKADWKDIDGRVKQVDSALPKVSTMPRATNVGALETEMTAGRVRPHIAPGGTSEQVVSQVERSTMGVPVDEYGMPVKTGGPVHPESLLDSKVEGPSRIGKDIDRIFGNQSDEWYNNLKDRPAEAIMESKPKGWLRQIFGSSDTSFGKNADDFAEAHNQVQLRDWLLDTEKRTGISPVVNETAGEYLERMASLSEKPGFVPSAKHLDYILQADTKKIYPFQEYEYNVVKELPADKIMSATGPGDSVWGKSVGGGPVDIQELNNRRRMIQNLNELKVRSGLDPKGLNIGQYREKAIEMINIVGEKEIEMPIKKTA